MRNKRRMPTVFVFSVLLQACAMCGCALSGEILSETNDDTRLCMEVRDYTDSLERTVTIKNVQSAEFYVELVPLAGEIDVRIADGNGDTILSMNEKATLTDDPTITDVSSGNGTYQVTIQLKKYSGSFDISWDVRG